MIAEISLWKMSKVVKMKKTSQVPSNPVDDEDDFLSTVRNFTFNQCFNFKLKSKWSDVSNLSIQIIQPSHGGQNNKCK